MPDDTQVNYKNLAADLADILYCVTQKVYDSDYLDFIDLAIIDAKVGKRGELSSELYQNRSIVPLRDDAIEDFCANISEKAADIRRDYSRDGLSPYDEMAAIVGMREGLNVHLHFQTQALDERRKASADAVRRGALSARAIEKQIGDLENQLRLVREVEAMEASAETKRRALELEGAVALNELAHTAMEASASLTAEPDGTAENLTDDTRARLLAEFEAIKQELTRLEIGFE